MTRRRPTTTVALGRGFHLMLSASAISSVGDGIALTALPLLAATLTRDPLPVSLVVSVGHLPWLVFGLVAGALADRHDRRRLMYGADLLRAGLLAALVAGLAFDLVNVWALVAFAFVLGTAGTLFDSAAQALIPALVPPADEALQRANSRLYGAQLVGAQLTGPAVGGVVFAAAALAPFAVDAVSFVGSAVLIASIHGRFRPDRGADAGRGMAALWREIGAGVRWLTRHRLLRALALLVATINVAITAGSAVLVLLVTGPLHLTSAGYGLLVSGGAVGGVLGGVVASLAGLRAPFLLAALLLLGCLVVAWRTVTAARIEEARRWRR